MPKREVQKEKKTSQTRKPKTSKKDMAKKAKIAYLGVMIIALVRFQEEKLTCLN